MKKFIDIIREAYTDEFSTKGHADMKIRRNDPRFGDNPLAYGDDYDDDEVEELDEFNSNTLDGMAIIDRLHDLLRTAGVTDPELKLGVKLTPQGLHKVAARLGVGPDEITMYLASLTDKVRNEDDANSLTEHYQRFMNEAELPKTAVPFPDAADAEDHDHLSAEPDALGNIEVRSSKTGNQKFFRGSDATAISASLKNTHSDREKDALLRPLVEDDPEPDHHRSSFDAEINSDSGTYNFPWKLNGQTGFGTVLYSTAGDDPQLKLISVRSAEGDDVDMEKDALQQLLDQARSFIGDA